MIKRIHELTSMPDDIATDIQRTFNRFLNQGHDFDRTLSLFQKAFTAFHLKRCFLKLLLNDRHSLKTTVYHHLKYHPTDPPSKVLQHLFRRYIIHPDNEPPLAKLTNAEGAPIDIDRLIVAYHNPKKLRNLLFPRRFAQDGGYEVSNLI